MAVILVVEDNDLNMELVTDVLEMHGHTVRQAWTAEEGLEIAAAERPDLILMDLHLPRMDGRTAVKQLKADPATRSIPTFALTADTMLGDEQAALDAGFDGFLTKPIDVRTFRTDIETALTRRPG